MCSPITHSSSEVLQRILVTEPDITPAPVDDRADQTHTLVAAFLAPYLVRHGMAEGTDLGAAADFAHLGALLHPAPQGAGT